MPARARSRSSSAALSFFEVGIAMTSAVGRLLAAAFACAAALAVALPISPRRLAQVADPDARAGAALQLAAAGATAGADSRVAAASSRRRSARRSSACSRAAERRQRRSELDAEATAALSEALAEPARAATGGEEENPRFEPGDTLVIQFSLREAAASARLGRSTSSSKLDDFRDRLARGNPYQLDGSGQLCLPGVPAIALAGLNVDEATVRVQAETCAAARSRSSSRSCRSSRSAPSARTVRLRPVRASATRVRSRHGHSGAGRLRDRPRRHGQRAAVRQPEHGVFPRPSAAKARSTFPRSARSTSAACRSRHAHHDQRARRAANDRRAREHHARRAALHSGVRARRRRAARLVHGQRPVDDHERAVRERRRRSRSARCATSRCGATATRSRRSISTTCCCAATRAATCACSPATRSSCRRSARRSRSTARCAGPAIYEIKNERTVADLLALAGGLNANANRAAVKLERVVPNRGTTVEDIDLRADGAQTAVRDGDVLRVQPNLEQLENSVRLGGNVFQPGLYQWFARHAAHATCLPAPELVKPLSDLNYVLIRRELAPNVDVEVCLGGLAGGVATAPAARANVALRAARHGLRVQPRHRPRSTSSRRSSTSSRRRRRRTRRCPSCASAVKCARPGEYPLEPGMRVSDLLRAGGGLSEAAYATDAELTRYAVVDGEYRETELITVDLAGAAARRRCRRRRARAVRLPERQRGVALARRGVDHDPRRGRVPRAPIRSGAARRLSSVLQRAGGLTDLAFPEGSVFTRASCASASASSSRCSRAASSAIWPRFRCPSRTRARRITHGADR